VAVCGSFSRVRTRRRTARHVLLCRPFDAVPVRVEHDFAIDDLSDQPLAFGGLFALVSDVAADTLQAFVLRHRATAERAGPSSSCSPSSCSPSFRPHPLRQRSREALPLCHQTSSPSRVARCSVSMLASTTSRSSSPLSVCRSRRA